MMHLDPRPLNPEDLTYQENARLMAHIREVAQEREMGPKKQRDLDCEERRAEEIWTSARTNFIPDPEVEYEVVCRRMDWYHGLFQLAGQEHFHYQQVSSWDPSWERMPFAGCTMGLHYEPLYGDHSPFRKEEFNTYRHVHFGMLYRQHTYAFRSKLFMDAVHAYYAQEDWMWNNNYRGEGLESFIWSNYFDPEEHRDWPFVSEEGDYVADVLSPRWFAMGGKPLTWCTYSHGMWCPESSTAYYGFREVKPGRKTLSELPF